MTMYYEAASVDITWVGVDLSKGIGSDTFLTIEPNSERVTVTPSANGEYAFSKMGDKGCTITLTLQQTSPTNDKIAQIFAAQDVVGTTLPIAPFTVVDRTGKSANFIALNAVLTEMPTNEFGAAIGEKTYVWQAETYLSSNEPSTILGALDQYTPFNL